jgi:hypothetical protein
LVLLWLTEVVERGKEILFEKPRTGQEADNCLLESIRSSCRCINLAGTFLVQ